jgi:hypothetical protein
MIEPRLHDMRSIIFGHSAQQAQTFDGHPASRHAECGDGDASIPHRLAIDPFLVERYHGMLETITRRADQTVQHRLCAALTEIRNDVKHSLSRAHRDGGRDQAPGVAMPW